MYSSGPARIFHLQPLGALTDEKTPQGEQEITQQHVQQLREARDEYQRMIEYLKSQG